jgi:molecular chaperone GrpE
MSVTDEPETERPEDEEQNEVGEEVEAQGAEADPEPVDPLAEAQEKAARLKDQLLRTAADFENFRKRAKRDVEEAARRSKEEVLSEILPIIDNLERAVQASGGAKDVQSVVQGVEMVLKSFADVAENLNLGRVKTVGEKFDPNVHDAIQQQETDEAAPGTILAEVVSGWTLGPKLIRPAMVVVAKPPSAEA